MKRLTPILILLLVSGCGRNLKEDIRLDIDETNVVYDFAAPENGNYVQLSDSDRVYDELLRELKSDFRDKGNVVTLISSTGDYTLHVLNVSFAEYITTETVSDPCGGTALTYDVSVITGSIKCEIMDNTGWHSQIVTAEAQSDEDVKNHPTLFQRIIGNDTCYTPGVTNAHPDAVKRRLVRRMHRAAMQVIRSMQ